MSTVNLISIMGEYNSTARRTSFLLKLEVQMQRDGYET